MPVGEGGISLKVLRQGRADFALITGHCTDRSWYAFKATLLELGLLDSQISDEDNLANIRKWANVRANLPKAGIEIKSSFKYYMQIEEKINQLKGRTLTGQEITDYLVQQGIHLLPSTRTNWFRTVGGYRRSRNYRPEELRTVFYFAAIYAARKKKK